MFIILFLIRWKKFIFCKKNTLALINSTFHILYSWVCDTNSALVLMGDAVEKNV
jgi:hypothetical protein